MIMFIQDEALRRGLKELLKTRTRNQIVTEIKERTGKFHHFQINNFLDGKDVALSTLIKLDEYLYKQLH
jgi:hypothetical protein